MLVLSWNQGFKGAPHQLISVETIHNHGVPLYVASRDEETRVHKNQGRGTT
jgi:hypothetical protein